MSSPLGFLPETLFTLTPRASFRVVEFFTAHLANPHTRKSYWNAARRFADWCGRQGIGTLETIQSIHVGSYIRELEAELSPPSVKQNLAALRMLFDWLVSGGILSHNPAQAVRGPKHVVKKGKTPVLTSEEIRGLLEAIPTTSITGYRDRALIAVMVYSFARVGAVLKMKVGDYFIQNRRGWIRLHEKGGKEHDVPCHQNLERYLDEYIAAADLARDREGYLFRSAAGGTGRLTLNRMWQQDAYRMIQRRAKAAGIETRISNHTFRATGITAYLKNGGQLETAQRIAAHESPRTTKLYDRRPDEIALSEIERIAL